MRRMVFLAVLWALLPALCGLAPPTGGDGLFSWDDDVVEEQARQVLFDDMEAAGLTVLYQYFSDECSDRIIREFLTDAASRGIRVYYLTGESEWGLDPEGEEMLRQVQRADSISRDLPEQARLQGVMMDTEPYLTDAWDDHESEVLACFAQAMDAVRRAAAERGLECMLCIPFYYDNDVEEPVLAGLIGGCDGLAIMNYSKHDEAGHIATEMALAGEKPVVVIYELQEPGSHGLKRSNTYYDEGLEGVRESFQALREVYDRDGFFCALHDYKALKELNGNE